MSNTYLKKMILSILVGSLITSVYAGGYSADNNNDLERELARTQNELDDQKERANDLDRKLRDLEGRIDSMASEPSSTSRDTSTRSSYFDTSDWPIHGYFSAAYADSSQDGSPSSFDQETVNLFLDYKLSDEFRFYGDVGFANGTEISIDGANVDGVGDVTVVEAFLEWKPNDWFLVRFGKFYTPFGDWAPNEIAPTTHSVWDPLLVRYSYHNLLSTGISSEFNFSMGDIQVVPSLFVANGTGAKPHNSDGNTDKMVGARLNFNFNFSEESNILWGVSAVVGRDESRTNDQQKIWGTHLNLNIARFNLRAETTKARINLDPVNDWEFVWFVQAGVNFLEKWNAFIRHDEADDNPDLVDGGDIKINGIGLAYRPIEPVAFKVQFDDYETDDTNVEDYHIVGAQVAVQF